MLIVMGVSPWIFLTCCTFNAASFYVVFIKSSHVGMRKGKSCELKPSFLKWYPISLSLHSYTQIGDETAIRGVELRSKDRVTLHLNLLPSNNWCYPICIYVFEFSAIHSSCRPIYLPSNFQAENASGCIFSCWVLEHQAPVFAKTMGTDETRITITYN